MGMEENQSVCTPSSAAKRKRKMGGDSDDDDDDDDDSDDPAEDDDDDEEEEIKKVKKVEMNDEVMIVPSLPIYYPNLTLKLNSRIFMILVSSFQDEVDQATSIEELEKQIEKLAKVCFSLKFISFMNSNINNLMSVPLGETDNIRSMQLIAFNTFLTLCYSIYCFFNPKYAVFNFWKMCSISLLVINSLRYELS